MMRLGQLWVAKSGDSQDKCKPSVGLISAHRLCLLRGGEVEQTRGRDDRCRSYRLTIKGER
jgi:hypothetical protein